MPSSLSYAADSDLPQTLTTLGGKLQTARSEQGLSMAQLSRRIGVNSDTLANWEKDRSEPRANQLMRLAGILNVSPVWLLAADESPFNDNASAETQETSSLSQKIERSISLQAQTVELSYDLQSETRRVQSIIDDAENVD